MSVKGSARVDGDRLDEVYAGLPAGQMVDMAEKEAIYGCRMQLVMARSPQGDLMCLATDLHVLDAVSTYKLRWSIECTFSSMKSRGFNLRQTGITQKERLERLFGLVTLAWTWSLRVGVDGARQPPIRVKSHGRKEASLVTAGWNAWPMPFDGGRPNEVRSRNSSARLFLLLMRSEGKMSGTEENWFVQSRFAVNIMLIQNGNRRFLPYLSC